MQEDWAADIRDSAVDFEFDEPPPVRGLFCIRQNLADKLFPIPGVTRPEPFPDGIEAHSGLLERYSRVRETLHREFRKNRPVDSRPLVICGHSYGGAMAQICALDFLWNYTEGE